jgi:hypothetical protein
MRLLPLALASLAVLAPGVAHADGATGSSAVAEGKDERMPRDDDTPFSFMRELARAGLHDPKSERFNVYGQLTWISSLKLGFHAPYTNAGGTPNSLLPREERSFTGTLTLFLGLGLWHGAEVYAVPEVISEQALSSLRGLGGAIQNFELQKTGSVDPTLYNSRLFIRQTIDLGGDSVDKPSGPMQLGREVKSRRIVLSAGNFSILDFFDHNSFSADLRRQFFNMAFLTYAAYDFAADARGYTYGAVVEIYFDDFALRYGRIAPPRDPNQLSVDPRFFKYYGDQIELEHTHRILGHEGVLRVLGYRNRENMARFDEAVAAFVADPGKNATTCTGFSYGSENASAPDLCWARKPNVKMGIGASLEQRLPFDIGIFARGMFSDGRTEVYSFTSADRSLSFGTLAKGTLWRRPQDSLGVGFGAAWISDAHADYLARGGIDGFIGDGRLRRSAEEVFETFYSLSAGAPVWLSIDFQHIVHPAYNRDRGPVNIVGARLHAEY